MALAQKSMHTPMEYNGKHRNPHSCSHLILDQLFPGENTASLIRVLGKLDTYLYMIKSRSLFLTPYKNQFKSVKVLDIRPETLELLKESIREKLEAIHLADLVNRTTSTQEIIARINQ